MTICAGHFGVMDVGGPWGVVVVDMVGRTGFKTR